MKRTMKNKALVLLSIGIFIISVTQLISQFIGLNDIVKGISIGFGIGLLLIAIIFGNLKTIH